MAVETEQREAGGSSALDERERREVEELSPPRAVVVFETIRREGGNELDRPFISLFASGVAAGSSMGFSLCALGLLRSMLPDAPWRPLVESLGYTVGFIVVIMGRQQLFTENTLTVVLPLLDGRDKLPLAAGVARVWAVVLCANLIGAGAFAWFAAHGGAFSEAARSAFLAIGNQAASLPPASLFVRGVVAGWLIALMVWMLPAAESTRPLIVALVTYVVGIAGFSHVIAGSVEVLYTVAAGERTLAAFVWPYALPVLAGNVIGGVTLVALLNYAQVMAEKRPAAS